MGKKKAPAHSGYEQFKDTPWIKQARDIAQIGGEGVMDNYNRVNQFDEDTRHSIEARNNAIYNRAFNEMDRNYTNTMNKYAANNYNRFGSLNSTPASFVTDDYQRQFQRQMDDLSFNKAMNYDKLFDAERQRRYDTLNMFAKMYQYGNKPHEIDVANWNTRNTNRDIAHNNAVADFLNGSSKGSAFGKVLGGIAGGVIGGPAGAYLGSKAGGSIGGFI